MTPPGPLSIPRLVRPPEVHWRVPGSKSVTNRALVLAALAEGTTTLTGVLHSDDTRHMRRGLSAFGVTLEEIGPTSLAVRGGKARLHPPEQPIFVGNSGTTVRFLTALAALVPGPVTLVGDEHMAKRPIVDLIQGMRQLGVQVDCDTGAPPLTVHGGVLPGGTVRMPGNRSSQYFSALLLAGSHAQGPLRLQAEGKLVSRPYVAITLRMIEAFGGAVIERDGSFEVQAPVSLSACNYAIEPDASSASYPFALAAGSGGRITVPGLTRAALQGDVGFVSLLEQAGASACYGDGFISVEGSGRLVGVDVDMHHISDTVMTLAALAPLSDGATTIRSIGNIRIKETDRLAALVAELTRLGQGVEHGADWLRIHPRPLTPANIRCYADHRMAMSFAVLGALRDGISIDDPACVSKTYPGFWRDLGACYSAIGQKSPF